MVDYYFNHEWIRWILFIPLTLFANAIAMVLLLFINYEWRESFFLIAFFLPIYSGIVTTYCIYNLAPRWNNFFIWLFFTINILNILSGIFLWSTEHPLFNIKETFASTVWFVSGFITLKRISS